jgi:hypothetical protein
MFIAQMDSGGKLIAPAYGIAKGLASTRAASLLGLAEGAWREITDAEAAELQKPPTPTAEALAAARMAEIHARMTQIDQELIRPLDARDEGTDTEYDAQKLAALRAEKRALREELAGLQGS